MTRHYVQLPIEPAGPWLQLPAMTRALGAELYRMLEERVLQVRLDQAEDVITRMLAPEPRERKAVRYALRAVIDAGLLVAVDGGVLLLYSRSLYQSHAPAKNTAPSTQGERMVDARSTDGLPMVDVRSTQGRHTVGANSSESLNSDSQRERVKERERDARGRARETPPRLAVVEVEDEPRPARPLVAVLSQRYDELFRLANGKAAPASERTQVQLRKAAFVEISIWSTANAQALQLPAAELGCKLLEGLFQCARAAKWAYPPGWVVESPTKYLQLAKPAPAARAPDAPVRLTGRDKLEHDLRGYERVLRAMRAGELEGASAEAIAELEQNVAHVRGEIAAFEADADRAREEAMEEVRRRARSADGGSRD